MCPLCAERIRVGQQAPPPLSLVRAAVYGAGAALAGCALYATVSIVTGYEFALMAIVVGIMVGKAIRHASHGLGGRPQQILAVVLTYFAITTSYIPVYIAQQMKKADTAASQPAAAQNPAAKTEAPQQAQAQMSAGGVVMVLLLLAAAAPFLSLGSGISGILSLIIIFFGLQQAWRRTGRSELLVMGPYEVTPAP